MEFKNRMMKDFCVEEYKSRIESEFLSLKMNDDMTVEEYAHKFVEKMKLVKYLVKDESYKVRRFMEGLHESFDRDVGNAATLTEAIFKAESEE